MSGEDMQRQWPEAHGYTLRDRELVTRLWDYARGARMSELYYAQCGVRLTRLNFCVELAIAVAASGSGLAGLSVMKQGVGAELWPWLAALAAFLAIAKPLLGLDRKIRQSGRQQQGYLRLLGTLEDLASDIQLARHLSAEHQQRFQRARTLHQIELQDDGYAGVVALSTLQARVNREMPPETLWVPELSSA